MNHNTGFNFNLFRLLKKKKPADLFSTLFRSFRSILDRNVKLLELMADMGEKLSGEYVFDRQYILTVTGDLDRLMTDHIADLEALDKKKNPKLRQAYDRIRERVHSEITGMRSISEIPFTWRLEEIVAGQSRVQDGLGNEIIMMSEIHHSLKFPVPDGFFLTARSMSEFMDYNGLTSIATDFFNRLEKGHGKEAEKALKNLKTLIQSGDVPRHVLSGLTEASERLKRDSGRNRLSCAVRGYEWSRDKESALHIPFRTYLNVPSKKLAGVYKDIIADFYSSSRLHHDPGIDFSVSAGFSSMVDAASSGFIRTLDPENPDREVMIIGATPGLAGGLEDAYGSLDLYQISREHPDQILSMQVTRKSRMLTLKGEDGTQWMSIPHYTCRAPSIKPEQLGMLAESAVLIERYFKRPLEILWCFDKGDRLYILKVSQLNLMNDGASGLDEVESAIRNATVLFSGQGLVVQSGIATGKVWMVKNDDDLTRFPAGAILVSPQTSPRFSKVIRKAKGILTGTGSTTGHVASMAREFRVPSIVNCGTALNSLKTGDEITIDATCNVVYSGSVRELQRFELTQEDPFEESDEYILLRRLKKQISPLNLIDPQNRNFTTVGCRTYHDIMRYIHEMAVQKLIELSKAYRHERHVPVCRLETFIPLGIFLADLDEELEPGPGNVLKEDDVRSLPMRSLLEGLRESGMWSTTPLSVDLGSFMSSLTRTFSHNLSAPEQVGMNLALVSSEYMNLSLRLGYHYTIVDALIGDSPEENRISFRFFGGVTDIARRSLRAKFIGEVLEKFDFWVESHGDLVVGRIKKAEKLRMMEKMKVIGGLIGYTRQLDVQLKSERCIAVCVDDFTGKINKTLIAS